MVVKANRMTQAKMPLSKVEHRIIGMLISQLEKATMISTYRGCTFAI
jgi:hypothetical protein